MPKSKGLFKGKIYFDEWRIRPLIFVNIFKTLKKLS